MANAPEIHFNGAPPYKINDEWKAILPMSFFKALGNMNLSANERLFLIVVCSQAEHFKMSEMQVRNLCGFCGATFDNVRKKLRDKGIIKLDEHKSLTINMDEIWKNA